MDELGFKTPSGKIELLAQKLESQGLSSLKPYESPSAPEEGSFRLTFGRCAVHTQGHTINNPMLFEQMPENVLWLNQDVGERMELTDGEEVEVSNNGQRGRIKVKLTQFIHPEAVFMVHGFGHALPVESRARGRGILDNDFMAGGLEVWDEAGGGMAMQEHFISVRKLS